MSFLFRGFRGVCLCLSPHLDDIELGCGGLISALINQGADVKVISFSFSEESLPTEFTRDDIYRECQEARAILGLNANDNMFFDFKTRYFPSERQQILEEMVKLRNRYNPDLVLLPSSHDIHQDHQVIYNEGCRAFQRAIKLGYQLPWNCTELSNNLKFLMSEESWNKKIQAVQCYQSQLVKPTFSIESVEVTARYNGNGKHAESFQFIGSTHAQ